MLGLSSANLPFTVPSGIINGTCAVYLSGVKTTVGCVYAFIPTQI